MKIGLLKCDTVPEESLALAGDFSEMFDRLFSRYCQEIELKVYDVLQGVYPQDLHECDGYLITGSRCAVYAQEPWIETLLEFIRLLYREKVKLIGVCFGHQAIAQALGGKCSKAQQGWTVGVKSVTVRAQKTWMQPPLDTYNLIVAHEDQIESLPQGSELLGSTENCPTFMFALGDHFLGIQGHPEFSVPYAMSRLYYLQEKIEPSTVIEAQQSFSTETQAGIIAQWMENFWMGNTQSLHQVKDP